ncbi:MAG: bifunctional nicotinamidase/pyrazinamidase [Chloroflexi bacterium]|nr:bifunctional nicotinamidase/pyrazinamidase [Chloroflexota bacterium]
MSTKDALLIVDVQNDFCPNGALGVKDGDQVVPILNEWARRISAAGGLVVATRDWHPRETAHFKELGGVWPVHCVQNTTGAAFHPELQLPAGAVVVSKGLDPKADGYSAFEAADEAGRPLAEILRERGVEHLYVGGLATDYCVKCSALDALRQGFDVTVIEEGIRGVDLQPGDSERALGEMRAAGAKIAAAAAR